MASAVKLFTRSLPKTHGETGSCEGSDQHLGHEHQVKEEGEKLKVRELLGGKVQECLHHKVIHQVAAQNLVQGQTRSCEGADKHLGHEHQVKEQGKKSKVRRLLGEEAQDTKVHEEISKDHPIALEKKKVASQMTVHKVPDGEQMPRPKLSKQAAEDVSVTFSNHHAEMGPDEQPRARSSSPSQSLPPTTRPAGAGWQCRAGRMYRLVALLMMLCLTLISPCANFKLSKDEYYKKELPENVVDLLYASIPLSEQEIPANVVDLLSVSQRAGDPRECGGSPLCLYSPQRAGAPQSFSFPQHPTA